MGKNWQTIGITHIEHKFQEKSCVSFKNLKERYGIIHTNFFKYQQSKLVNGFYLNQTNLKPLEYVETLFKIP